MQFKLYLVNRAIRPWPRGMRSLPHCHFYYELGIPVSGEAIWHLKGRAPMTMDNNCAILISPKQHHHEVITKTATFLWVGFGAPANALHDVPINKKITLGHWREDILLAGDQLAKEYARCPFEHEKRTSLYIQDLLILLRRTQKSELIEKSSHRIDPAAAYLEHNAAEPLTMTQVAQYHGYSLAHFETLFMDRFACSPKEYQQQCKLRLVEQHMKRGIHSAKTLAAALGFQDVAYFCRWFKKQTGKTTTEYFRKFAKDGTAGGGT